MKKVLFITNIAGKTMKINFCAASLIAAQKNDLEFWSVANRSASTPEQMRIDEQTYSVKLRHIDLDRSPFSKANLAAYKQLVSLIKQEDIDYIHCNTPVGGMLGRLAGKKCKVKKVIYQVHGFHFYKGAPLKNWLLYYPVEKFLARYTDAIITINTEDYEFSKKLRLRKGGKTYYVPGVGVDSKSFENHDPELRAAKRAELGIPLDAFLLISAGDLNKNKNNCVILSAMAKCNNPNVHYILCGLGPEADSLRQQAQTLGISDRVHFLGYRTDLKELLHTSDLFVMPSFREGLSRSIMEAMSCGLPCLVSKIRGNVDLLIHGEGGFLFSASDVDSFAEGIRKIAESPELAARMKANNLERVKLFDLSVIEQEMDKVYREVFSSEEVK